MTGASRGVGRAIALRLGSRGYRVIAVGRDRDALERTRAASDGAVSIEVCDVTDEQQVIALCRRVGAAEVLVSNAGASASAPIGACTLGEWQDQMAVNATGAFLMARQLIGGMSERDHGRIVIVASTAGLAGSRYTAGYTASKHAAVGLMRALASEVAGTGVTVNAVCPTFVDTEMTQRSAQRIARASGRDHDQAIAALARQSPLGRLLAPEEVAAAVEFLASAEARAINGQTLVLDGGGIQR